MKKTKKCDPLFEPFEIQLLNRGLLALQASLSSAVAAGLANGQGVAQTMSLIEELKGKVERVSQHQ